jgi:transposase
MFLTDEQWALIEPHLRIEPKSGFGRPRADCRQVFEAVLFMLHTGMQWRFLPRSFPPKSTVHDYLQGWCQKGSFRRLLSGLIRDLLERGQISIDQGFVDATFAPAKGGGAGVGLTRKKGTKAFWQVPSYTVFYQVLTRMDPEPFAALLDGWLQAQAGTLPRALALDGKMIRDHIGPLTLAHHEDGAPQSVAVYDQKENTPRCEQTAALALLQRQPALDGKIVTADPLHCQKQTVSTIVGKGGDYLLQIKGNQPSLLQQAKACDALEDTPFLSKTALGMAGPNNAAYTSSP